MPLWRRLLCFSVVEPVWHATHWVWLGRVHGRLLFHGWQLPARYRDVAEGVQ